MSLANCGVEDSLVAEMFAASRTFFDLEESRKQALGYSGAEDNFGYQGVGEESLEPGTEPDLKEALTMRDFFAHVDAAWPSSHLRDVCGAFYSQCLAAAHRVQRVFAAALGVEEEFFVRRHTGENVTLRLLHYPPVPARSGRQMGAGAHTDYGMLTLLFQDQVGGLEVRDRGGVWQAVEPVPGHVVVNTGDLMEHWTNGRFRSTLHRVQPRHSVGDRYSIAMFCDPDPDVLIDCLPSCVTATNPARYAPILAGEHIQQKIRATHQSA